MTFVQQLAERLGLDDDATRAVLADWVTHVREELSAEGQHAIPNLGVFRSFGGTLVFEPTQELARLVNNRFTGLENLNVPARPAHESAAAPPEQGVLEDTEDQPGDEGVSIFPAPPLPEEPSTPPPAAPDVPEFAPSGDQVPGDEFAPPMERTVAPSGPPPSEHEEREEAVPQEESEWEDDEGVPPGPVELEEPATAAESDLVEAFPASPATAESSRPVEPEDRAAQTPPRDRIEEPERRSRWPLLLLGVLLLAVAGIVALVLTREEPESAPAAITEGPPPTIEGTPQESLPGPATEPGASEPEGPPAPAPEAEQPPAQAPEETPLRAARGIDRDAGGFALIVASSVRRDYAEEVASSYRQEGYRTDLLAEEVEGVTRYRVAIGQFSTLAAATAARNELAGALPEGTWVLRIRPDM